MKYFNNIHNAEELRKAYRQNVINMHPDRGGNEEQFKAMQAEFEALKKQYQNGTAYNYESRQTETAEERARREAEEQREREEWARWEAEEKAAREQEERERAERIRKAQEVTAAAVRAWAAILERVPVAVAGRIRAYHFEDKKQAAAFVATTKRNIIKVINHYFPGLKVKVTISGEIWKEKFIISWEDGPSEKELRDTCKELAFFVPNYYESDPYADYGDYKTREGSAPWREAYGQALGDVDNFETSRTLSEEGKKQAEEMAARYFANFDPKSEADKFAANLEELGNFAKAGGFDGENLTNIFRTITGQFHADMYGCWADITGEVSRRELRKMLAEHVRVNVTPKPKAPTFAPVYGPTYKAIKKALGGKVFYISDDRKEKELTIFEAAELLAKGEAVQIGHRSTWDGEPVIYGTDRGGYKTQQKRAAKFEAVGIILEGIRCTVYGYVNVEGIKAETLEALRREAQDIEKQREEWENKQNGTQKAGNGKKAAKTANTPTDTQNTATGEETAPAEGLTLEDIAEGVAVIGDSRTTYKHRREIKAHGAKWNKEAQRWEATNPDDVAKLRAWFAMREQDEPTATATESEALRGATLQEIERHSDRTTAPAWLKPGQTFRRTTADGREVVAICTRILLDGFAYLTANGCGITDHVAAFAAFDFDSVTPCDIDDKATEFAHMLHNFQRIRKDFEKWQTAHPYEPQDEPQAAQSEPTTNEPQADTTTAQEGETLPEWAKESAKVNYTHKGQTLRGYITNIHKAYKGGRYVCQFHEDGTLFSISANVTDCTPLQQAPEIAAMLEAVADMLRTFADIMQQAKQWEGVTIPADTLERWKQETNEGTKTAAARFCEVCACLASLTPDSRRDFDALGVIFWTLSEQIRNGYNPDTLQGATDYARAQLFDLIERTQTRNQADRLREVLDPDNNPRREAA